MALAGRTATLLTALLTGLLAGLLTGPTLLPASAAVGGPPEPAAAAPAGPAALHLVALRGSGTASVPREQRPGRRAELLRRQDAVLAAAGSPPVVYRWTTALSGVAVRLDPDQARALAADDRVVLVEPDEVRRLAGAPTRTATAPPAPAPSATGPATGGRGTVVGVVDSGIDPRSASFAALRSLGPAPRPAAGCRGAWEGVDCGGKLVAARWFVAGFGRDRLRSGSSLSPLDDDGHGTQVASIAAGNAGVPVRVPGRRATATGGQAPDARLAVYKACWSAPDPGDDGCATADLVTAVDRAVADDVDVLGLSVAGGTDPAGSAGRVDVLERALLGATEADVVVLAAAGNDPGAAAAYDVPWVTTVGGGRGRQPTGVVEVAGGPAWRGAGAARTPLPPAPATTGSLAATPDAAPSRAGACAPGSLDAAAVSGRVVVCERGLVGRVDKSAAVALADGVGMVLVNRSGRATYADFHDVPTVHLAADDGRALLRALRRDPDARVGLRPARRDRPAGRLAPSAPGTPAAGVVKPDVVAPAAGLLGAVPPGLEGRGGGAGWDVAAGTSAATAWAAGTAATVRARRPAWDAATVRSALVTTARPVREGVLVAGAGRVDADRAAAARLDLPQPAADLRRTLDGAAGDPGGANTPSVLLAGRERTAARTIRNTADDALYFSSSARGFEGGVQVRPLAVRLGPGERSGFTVRSTGGGPAGVDDGFVVWRGGDGSRSRVPVVVVR